MRLLALTILFAATTYADSFTFNTIPAGGNLTAAAGATAGWGYTVTNNSLDQWLMFSGPIWDPLPPVAPSAHLLAEGLVSCCSIFL